MGESGANRTAADAPAGSKKAAMAPVVAARCPACAARRRKRSRARAMRLRTVPTDSQAGWLLAVGHALPEAEHDHRAVFFGKAVHLLLNDRPEVVEIRLFDSRVRHDRLGRQPDATLFRLATACRIDPCPRRDCAATPYSQLPTESSLRIAPRCLTRTMNVA